MSDKPECGRCHKKDQDWQYCWWCHHELCYECWDEVGHCGHPDAEAMNEAGRAMDTPL